MSPSPIIVFIPGAWHKPSCSNKIISVLQDEHEMKCISITLPSTTDDPAAIFENDVDTAATPSRVQRRTGATTNGRNVVVIAYSYGGMVANSAIHGFAKPRDAVVSSLPSPPNNDEGHVIGLILIASGFTLTGLAFMDPFFGRPPPSWRVNIAIGFTELVTPPAELFYHDLPADEAEYWVSQLQSQSLKALFERGEYAFAGWMEVPAWYIGTVEDRGLPVLMQRLGVELARGMGGNIVHREMQTSHSPFLSLPEVRLWQPISWVKFGLPLRFAHVLGWGVLAFHWARRLWGSKVKLT